MTHALILAKYMVTRRYQKGQALTNDQLNQLLFQFQSNWIEKKKKPCFKEDFIASMSGPIIPQVYEHFLDNGPIEITRNYVIGLKDFKEMDPINTFIDRFEPQEIPYMPKAWEVALQKTNSYDQPIDKLLIEKYPAEITFKP